MVDKPPNFDCVRQILLCYSVAVFFLDCNSER